jgi:hypothetical protein
MAALDMLGQAILALDALVLIVAAGWAWREGRSDGGTLTRRAALVACLGLTIAAAIVVYGLMR